MSALEVFSFPATGQEIRTVVRDGEPWFVAADVCSVLGYNNGRMAVGRLPERMKGVTEVDTLGGRQSVALISEPGAYRLIMRSNLPAAEAFQDWIAEEVVPAIRRTGRYEVAAVSRKELARMVLESEEARELAEAKLAIVGPKAMAWDVLASTDADYSVREAAHILNRDTGIDTGQNRLFQTLRNLGVIDRRNRPYAAHSKHARLRPTFYPHPVTREQTPGDPQVRITVEGLAYLHKRLGGTDPFTHLAPAPEVSAA